MADFIAELQKPMNLGVLVAGMGCLAFGLILKRKPIGIALLGAAVVAFAITVMHATAPTETTGGLPTTGMVYGGTTSAGAGYQASEAAGKGTMGQPGMPREHTPIAISGPCVWQATYPLSGRVSSGVAGNNSMNPTNVMLPFTHGRTTSGAMPYYQKGTAINMHAVADSFTH